MAATIIPIVMNGVRFPNLEVERSDKVPKNGNKNRPIKLSKVITKLDQNGFNPKESTNILEMMAS
jgi:hypothetical protein